jgi:trans-aconitate methyltransferase
MSRFGGSTGFYLRYRPGIPRKVADILDAAVSGGRRRLLDIGTGTGLVVEALLGRFGDIIAIDSDPEMLRIAEAALRPKAPDGTSLKLQRCAAEEFMPPAEWQADLVTICRAFHWLEQPKVLQRLDSQVSASGAVAIFGDNSFWTATSAWPTTIRTTIQRFLGEQRRAGASTFAHHNRPYSDIMRESPFDRVEEFTVPVVRNWSADSILGYLYSTSFAAPHLFGERLTEFRRDVTNAPPSSSSAPPTPSPSTTSS